MRQGSGRWEESTAGIDFTYSSRKAWSLIRRLGAAQKPPTFGTILRDGEPGSQSPDQDRKSSCGRGMEKAGSRWMATASIPQCFEQRNWPIHPWGSVGGSFTYQIWNRNGLRQHRPGIHEAPWSKSSEMVCFFPVPHHVGTQQCREYGAGPKSSPSWSQARILTLPRAIGRSHYCRSASKFSSASSWGGWLRMSRKFYRPTKQGFDQAEVRATKSWPWQPSLKTVSRGKWKQELCCWIWQLHTTLSGTLVSSWNWQRPCLSGWLTWWGSCYETGEFEFTSEKTPADGGCNQMAFHRDRSWRQHFSTCAPMTSLLHPSRKFIYADDICCCSQAKSFEELEKTLTEDMDAIAVYCRKWRLQPSVAKTVSCVFHLHNANAKRKIDVRLNGQSLKCETKPVYLGVTLDRSLTYHDHLMKTAAKVSDEEQHPSAGWLARRGVHRRRHSGRLPWHCVFQWQSIAHRSGAVVPTLTWSTSSWTRRWGRSREPCVPLHYRGSQSSVTSFQPAFAARRRSPGWSGRFRQIRISHLSRTYSTLQEYVFCPGTLCGWRYLALSSLPCPPGKKIGRIKLSGTVSLSRTHRFALLGLIWCAQIGSHSTATALVMAGVRPSLHQWGIQDNPFCSCGSIQTMSHIVDECPLTKFNGGLRALHSADGQAVEWLRKRSAR